MNYWIGHRLLGQLQSGSSSLPSGLHTSVPESLGVQLLPSFVEGSSLDDNRKLVGDT